MIKHDEMRLDEIHQFRDTAAAFLGKRTFSLSAWRSWWKLIGTRRCGHVADLISARCNRQRHGHPLWARRTCVNIELGLQMCDAKLRITLTLTSLHSCLVSSFKRDLGQAKNSIGLQQEWPKDIWHSKPLSPVDPDSSIHIIFISWCLIGFWKTTTTNPTRALGIGHAESYSVWLCGQN